MLILVGMKDVMMVLSLLLLLLMDKGPDDDASSRLAVVGAAAAAAEKTEIGAEVKRFLSSERREGKKGRKSGRERKWL